MLSQLLPFLGTARLIPLTPRAGLFFPGLRPQCAPPQGPRRLFSVLRTAMGAGTQVGWLSVYASVVPRAGDVLRRPPVRRALDRVTGAVLIGLGVRLALTR